MFHCLIRQKLLLPLQFLQSKMKFKNIFKRKKNSHKNDYGHVFIVAGSYNMPGAAVLCANAAITAGAGLVTLAFPRSCYNAISKKVKPEIMLLPLNDSKGKLSGKSKKTIVDFIQSRRVTSAVLGCGSGRSEALKNIISEVIKSFEIPVIIDADGLNVFEKEQKNGIIKQFKNAKAKIILTPHPKEFERISGVKYKDSKPWRKQETKLFCANNGTICVLKGNNTVVSDGFAVYVNKTGNPGMATAGSGDVLAGITAAFAGYNNADLMLKVKAAVYAHGLAGDIAAAEKTQICLTAGDIISNMPKAIRRIIK